MSENIRIFQVFYNQATRAALDPEFEPLDNSGNERPEWREYWPISRFLGSNTLEEGCYYGFLSPKFGVKTGLGGRQVKDFVAQADGADVVTFSPFPDQAACYFNMFEQCENHHPGAIAMAQAFFDAVGMNLEVTRLVMDTRSTVYCNYFVAKPVFWRRWKQVLDRCLEHIGNPYSPVGARLNARTPYDNGYSPMWVMIMERVAATLLARDRDITVKNYPPFLLPLAHPVWTHLAAEIVALDALKRSYLTTQVMEYLQSYRALQHRTIQAFQQLSARGVAPVAAPA
ncbi:MAG: hypothetical protein P4L83_01300 [Nevskia sp.]|nr:hypothetical protein [Nevskia sp.]